MRGSMPWTGSPITSTSPALGRSRPEMRPSVVDLPQPVGPTTATNSPGATAILMSRIAVYALPAGVRNRLVTSRNSIAYVPWSGAFCVPVDTSFIGRELFTALLSWMVLCHHFVYCNASHLLQCESFIAMRVIARKQDVCPNHRFVTVSG